MLLLDYQGSCTIEQKNAKCFLEEKITTFTGTEGCARGGSTERSTAPALGCGSAVAENCMKHMSLIWGTSFMQKGGGRKQ